MPIYSIPGIENFYPRPPRGGRRDVVVRVKIIVTISIHALREEGDALRGIAALAGNAISIHALREEGDRESCPCWCTATNHFYPRPPRGGRRSLAISREPPTPDFYPRPPRGGRPDEQRAERAAVDISIHALREEGDRGKVLCMGRREQISIHALREEGDSKNREKTPCFCLIIHLSAQIAKRCLQTKPQNHTVTCANGWYSGAKRPGKPCVLPIRTGRTSKDQHAVLGKFWVQSNVLDLGLVVVA